MGLEQPRGVLRLPRLYTEREELRAAGGGLREGDPSEQVPVV